MGRKDQAAEGMAKHAMFELANANVALIHKNERLEMHGNETKLACDLKFEYEMANTGLAMFHPSLRSAIYQPSQSDQGTLIEDQDYLPSLKFPALSSLKWGAGDLVGAELRFHYGTSEKSHVVFSEAKICKYKLDCKEGGTVLVSFDAQVYPTETQSGKLSKILTDKLCTISITPPEAPADLGE